MSVITVQGEIEADQLGIVSPHEHILLDLRNQFREFPDVSRKVLSEQQVGIGNLDILRRNPLAIRDNLVLDDWRLAEEEVSRFHRAGGDTIVDVTNIGLGRDVVALRSISRAVGINIIAGCGYYYHDTHPQDMDERTVADIRQEMLADIQIGIDGTGIRAGVIGELGISEEIHPNEEKVLIAAAEAQAQAGVGIQVHIFPWKRGGGFPLGLEVLDILAKSGANLHKVAIDHADVAMGIKLDYCREIAKRGAYVEFDNFGHEFYVDKRDRKFIPGPFARDTERVGAIKELLDSGYLSNLLVSTDICHKCLLHRYGGWGYDHILTNIVSMMSEYGITDQQIAVLLRDNPRSFLNIES